MKKIFFYLFCLAPFSQVANATYPVWDARGNQLLTVIQQLNGQQLVKLKSIASSDAQTVELLTALYKVLGEPPASTRSVGKSGGGGLLRSVGGAISSGASSISGGGGSFSGGLDSVKNTVANGMSSVNSAKNNIGSGINSAMDSLGNASLGDVKEYYKKARNSVNLGSVFEVEDILKDVPGMEGMDIRNIFKSVGRIRTFTENNFSDFKQFYADPVSKMTSVLNERAFGIADDLGISQEMMFAQRISGLSDSGLNKNKGEILSATTDFLSSRVFNSIESNAVRLESLAVETEQGFASSTNAQTQSEQNAANNRIAVASNMAQLEAIRQNAETQNAQLAIQNEALVIKREQINTDSLERALRD